MMLEHSSIFAKLQADLHPGFLSKLMTFSWAGRAEQATLGALAISGDVTTAHARRLVEHGESVYNSLRLLESIALEISSLLAAEGTAVKREKGEISSRVLTIFGRHRSALRILDHRVAELHGISQLWIEARGFLSLGIHAFNGVRSDLTALSEHQSGPMTARLLLPADEQDRSVKGWVRRLNARRVLMPAHVGILLPSRLILSDVFVSDVLVPNVLNVIILSVHVRVAMGCAVIRLFHAEEAAI
jgi:hypothetical protein